MKHTLDGRTYTWCERCKKSPTLKHHDICSQCRGEVCVDELPHDGDPCVRCGYKQTYGQGDNIAEVYEESVQDIEWQAQLAAYELRRAICKSGIADHYGVKTEAIDIINDIIGADGVGYKLILK